jgi:hypothetical protein
MYHYVAAQSSFMIVLVADAQAHVQRLVLVVRMTTVLEVCTTKEQRSVVQLFGGGGAKGLHAKDIKKKNYCLRWEVFVA